MTINSGVLKHFCNDLNFNLYYNLWFILALSFYLQLYWFKKNVFSSIFRNQNDKKKFSLIILYYTWNKKKKKIN